VDDTGPACTAVYARCSIFSLELKQLAHLEDDDDNDNESDDLEDVFVHGTVDSTPLPAVASNTNISNQIESFVLRYASTGTAIVSVAPNPRCSGSSPASACAFSFLFRDFLPSDFAVQISKASVTVDFASTSDAL
jgi:hypothetical protein